MKTPAPYVLLAHLALLPLVIFAFVIAKDLQPIPTAPLTLDGLFIENFPLIMLCFYGLVWSFFRKETIREMYAMPFREKFRKYWLETIFCNLLIIPQILIFMK